jgi:hypothetical protein
MVALRRSLALALTVVAVGCRPPVQNGGVVVLPGAAERLAAFCRWRRPDPEGPAFCAAKEPATKGARARRLRAGDALARGGAARAGDFALEGGEITLVVGDAARGAGEGGALLEVLDARAQKGAIGPIASSFGAGRGPIYEGAEGGVTKEGAAYVELVGHDRDDARLVVTTRVELAPGARAARVTTTLENRGDSAVGPLDLGDRVALREARLVGAGPLRTPAGPALCAIGPGAAYALVSLGPGGLEARGDALVARAGIRIAPGERATYERAIVVGVRADELALAAELDVLGGGEPGAVEVRFEGPRGAAVPLPEGAIVRLAPAGGAPDGAALPLLLRVTRDTAIAPDRVGGEAPVGRFSVSLEGSARRAVAPVVVDVRPAEIAHVTIALEPAAE